MMDMLDWSSIDFEGQQGWAHMMSHGVQETFRNLDFRKINFSIGIAFPLHVGPMAIHEARISQSASRQKASSLRELA